MTYTLQSTINGKYISSLFSDSHKETFKATNINDAYKWYNRSTVEAIQKTGPRIHDCKIVEI